MKPTLEELKKVVDYLLQHEITLEITPFMQQSYEEYLNSEDIINLDKGNEDWTIQILSKHYNVPIQLIHQWKSEIIDDGSSTNFDTYVRCSGMTKKNKECNNICLRMSSFGEWLMHRNDELYCNLHTKN